MHSEKIFLKDGLIYDPLTKEKFEKNIIIDNGIIKDLTTKKTVPKSYYEIDCSGMILTTGFIDLRSNFTDPGNAYQETLYSGALSAVFGGYTKVCIMPGTNPVIDSPEVVEYINSLSDKIPIDIFTIGAATKGLEGKEISEIGLMHKAGIVAVSDYENSIQNSQLFRMVIEYSKKFNIPIINHPEDYFLSNLGKMNEGDVSTKNGMSGAPSISESTIVFRDISIAGYVDGRIHIPRVSSNRSIKLIERAKKEGISITAEVTPHHLYFNDQNFLDFSSRWKVNPPIRDNFDREKLVEALIDGTIDCISTDHNPQTIESKESDVYNASAGSIGLESSFGAVNKVLSTYKVEIFKIIDWFTSAPASIMNISIDQIVPGTKVNLVALNPNKKWIFNSRLTKSKSENSIFENEKLHGKVEYTIIGSKIFSNKI